MYFLGGLRLIHWTYLAEHKTGELQGARHTRHFLESRKGGCHGDERWWDALSGVGEYWRM